MAYTVVNEWSTGFQADVRIRNTSARAVNGWTVSFGFTGNKGARNAEPSTYTLNSSACDVE